MTFQTNAPARGVGFTTRVETLAQEVRQATRKLRQSPGFTVVAIFTIAIGVGAATSMSGILRDLVFAPPPHVDTPGRVFRLHQVFPHEDGREEVSDVDLWLPLFVEGDGSGQAVTWHLGKTSFNLIIALRLRSSASDQQVAAEFTNLYRTFLSAQYLEGLLFRVSPRDPIVLVAVSAVVLTLAMCASLLPAWRVSGIDPASILRVDC